MRRVGKLGRWEPIRSMAVVDGTLDAAMQVEARVTSAVGITRRRCKSLHGGADTRDARGFARCGRRCSPDAGAKSISMNRTERRLCLGGSLGATTDAKYGI